jgi:hypothetical protein
MGIKDKATKTSKEAATWEYLTWLFLLLACNTRHGPLKTNFDNMF